VAGGVAHDLTHPHLIIGPADALTMSPLTRRRWLRPTRIKQASDEPRPHPAVLAFGSQSRRQYAGLAHLKNRIVGGMTEMHGDGCSAEALPCSECSSEPAILEADPMLEQICGTLGE